MQRQQVHALRRPLGLRGGPGLEVGEEGIPADVVARRDGLADDLEQQRQRLGPLARFGAAARRLLVEAEVLAQRGIERRQEARARDVVGQAAKQPDGIPDLGALEETLAPDPELLILDDPALGLDPVARRSLVESMIYLTRRSDRTIFFSSHHLGDVERVADYHAVLDYSVLRACCPLESFRSSVREVQLRFAGAPPVLPAIPGMLQAFRTEHELRVTCVHYNGETEKALRALAPVAMEAVPLGLEDAFISYLGERGEKTFILSDTEMSS